MTAPQPDSIEAAVFRRLLRHLDENKAVQNIDLMNLAGFCRNCLAKWYVAAAEQQGAQVDYEAARQRVYGMPYGAWKARYQTGEHIAPPASPSGDDAGAPAGGS